MHIAHPNQVRAFARACGYQAKTDGLDAMVLSRYGQVFQPASTLAQEADRGQLQDLLRRREQLVGQRTQEKNRLSRVHNPAAQDSVGRHIAWLDQEIGMLDDQYQELLDSETPGFRNSWSRTWSFGDRLRCIAACRVWVSRPPPPWSPGCPSWAGVTERHWPPCVAWRPDLGTAVKSGATDPPVADAGQYDACCTWPAWPQSAAPRGWDTSTGNCVSGANRAKWPWWQ